MGVNSTNGEWMRSGSRFLHAALATWLVLAVLCPASFAQEPGAGLGPAVAVAADDPPDAPRPQFETSVAEPPVQQAQTSQTQPAQDSSSTQAPVPQTGADQSRHEKAGEQLKEEEKQRVLGILPAFNTSYRGDAVSLTGKQKIRLAFRSATDLVAFGTALLAAGYGEAADSDSGFPWGAKGYGERAGAKYLDAFNGTMIGNGFLPALLHQDPRYFRLGHGSTRHRLLYAMATSVICKHDNSGRWEPNYSNVLGNIASGALSSLYYPPSDSGVGQTFTTGFVVTAEGTVGGIFQEFWPDVSRKFFHKDPTHGLDAQARAADRAAQQTKQNGKQ
jgi:hypothetical protein